MHSRFETPHSTRLDSTRLKCHGDPLRGAQRTLHLTFHSAPSLLLLLLFNCSLTFNISQWNFTKKKKKKTAKTKGGQLVSGCVWHYWLTSLHCVAILCRRFTHSASALAPPLQLSSPLPSLLGISLTEKVVSLSLRGLTVCLIAQPQPQHQHRLSLDLTWLDFLETSLLYWPFRPCPSHTQLPYRCCCCSLFPITSSPWLAGYRLGLRLSPATFAWHFLGNCFFFG